MVTYFKRTGTNFYGDYAWKEVEVDESKLEQVDNGLFMYKGELLHQADPQNDDYFWIRFGSYQINWLPNTKAFPK